MARRINQKIKVWLEVCVMMDGETNRIAQEGPCHRVSQIPKYMTFGSSGPRITRVKELSTRPQGQTGFFVVHGDLLPQFYGKQQALLFFHCFHPRTSRHNPQKIQSGLRVPVDWPNLLFAQADLLPDILWLGWNPRSLCQKNLALSFENYWCTSMNISDKQQQA